MTLRTKHVLLPLIVSLFLLTPHCCWAASTVPAEWEYSLEVAPVEVAQYGLVYLVIRATNKTDHEVRMPRHKTPGCLIVTYASGNSSTYQIYRPDLRRVQAKDGQSTEATAVKPGDAFCFYGWGGLGLSDRAQMVSMFSAAGKASVRFEPFNGNPTNSVEMVVTTTKSVFVDGDLAEWVLGSMQYGVSCERKAKALLAGKSLSDTDRMCLLERSGDLVGARKYGFTAVEKSLQLPEITKSAGLAFSTPVMPTRSVLKPLQLTLSPTIPAVDQAPLRAALQPILDAVNAKKESTIADEERIIASIEKCYDWRVSAKVGVNHNVEIRPWRERIYSRNGSAGLSVLGEERPAETDQIPAALAEDPDLVVIQIGAGFLPIAEDGENRPLRLLMYRQGGSFALLRWNMPHRVPALEVTLAEGVQLPKDVKPVFETFVKAVHDQDLNALENLVDGAYRNQLMLPASVVGFESICNRLLDQPDGSILLTRVQKMTDTDPFDPELVAARIDLQVLDVDIKTQETLKLRIAVYMKDGVGAIVGLYEPPVAK